MKRVAIIPAKAASNADFNRIVGKLLAAGVPNNNEFINGEAIAVRRPTLQPYLYAPCDFLQNSIAIFAYLRKNHAAFSTFAKKFVIQKVG